MSVKNNVVGFIKNAAIEDLTSTAAGTIGVDSYLTLLNVADNHSMTLPDGTDFGQLKKIYVDTLTATKSVTLAITSAASTSLNQVVFDAVGETVTLMWVRNQGSTQTDEPTAYWRIIDYVGATIS